MNTFHKKNFWKAVKCLNSSIPILSLNSTEAFTSYDKAEMLNNYFGQCFNQSLPPLTPKDIQPKPGEQVEDILCSVEEIQHYLETLDTSKASGPDGISAHMLKGTASSIAPSLTQLFNNSLRAGLFPDAWKLSRVVPIHKSGESNTPLNYRPISLLPILSKVFERHMHMIMSKHLDTSSVLSDQQWGFRSMRTILALLNVTYYWFSSLDRGAEVCAIFFDLRKAFDSVPHRHLITTLMKLNFPYHLVKWICSYLLNRYQQVVIDGATLQSVNVKSGVPQGSVLGPLLVILH